MSVKGSLLSLNARLHRRSLSPTDDGGGGPAFGRHYSWHYKRGVMALGEMLIVDLIMRYGLQPAQVG